MSATSVQSFAKDMLADQQNQLVVRLQCTMLLLLFQAVQDGFVRILYGQWTMVDRVMQL